MNTPLSRNAILLDNDAKDIVSKVITKLSVLDNLFEFYCYARDKTGFQKESTVGLSYIISDCVNELEGILR